MPLLAILAIGALLRLGVLLVRSFNGTRFLTPDGVGYLTLSRDLGAFGSTSNPHFALGLLRTPVYPLYLAVAHEITHSRIVGPMVIQVLVGVATIYLLYRLVLVLFDRTTARCAALILAIDPVSIVYNSVVLTETLFTFFLLASVYVLWRPDGNRRWTHGALAGAFLGVATLTRPVSVYLSVVLAIAYLVLERKRLRAAVRVAVCFLLAFAVFAGGWTIRNDVTGGVATISTIEGYNFLYYRAVGALAEGHHTSDAKARNELVEQLQRKLPPHPSPGQVDTTEQSLAETVIRHNLGGYVEEAALGGGRLIFGIGGAESTTATGGHANALIEGYSGLYLFAIYFLGLVGLLAAWYFRKMRNVVLSLLVMAYVLVVSSGLESYSRFRVPIMPFVALFAGVGALAIVGRGPDGTRFRGGTTTRDEVLAAGQRQVPDMPPPHVRTQRA